MASDSRSEDFARIAVRVADEEAAGRVSAEAFEAGAAGIEQRDAQPGLMLLLYVRTSLAREVARRVAEAVGGDARVGRPEAVPSQDWPETWKRHLEAIVISPRLVVRPSFVAHALGAGQAELVIDPGQAFGTGAHVSTRLALEWIDALAPGLAEGARVLDAGTGSGVLALAALRLAPVEAVGFDLDSAATEAAVANARANGLAARFEVVTGGLADVRGDGFELVAANMLRRELEPLLGGLAARTRKGGHAIFSGLVTRECEVFGERLDETGLGIEGERRAADPSGESWSALLTTRR
jgi:ribosomal protein L11 methyltransferase